MDVDTLTALACLSSRQREVAIDRMLLDRTHSAIAADMGVSRNTVLSLERKAKALLGLLLEARP